MSTIQIANDANRDLPVLELNMACDGEEALQIFGAHRSDIDLIVTDLVMPKLGGRQLYDTLRQEGKKVKFILTSGYTLEEVHESAAFDPPSRFCTSHGR